MPLRSAFLRSALPLILILAAAPPALAQMGHGGPPAVGVTRAEVKPIIETNEFVGRIRAMRRVNIVARVTAFLDKRLFTEGAEVKKGQLLYVLEQPPFQADVQAKQAAVAQAQAQLENATTSLNRAKSLLASPAGNRSTYDNALATQRSDAAQVLAAQAQLQQAQINLAYTEIHAPIDGKIGDTLVNVGNVVTPSSGALTTIVSQDPMYVSFPISVRTAVDLRDRYAGKGGLNAVQIRIRLPNGKLYGQTGKLDFVANTVNQNTDTIMLRGVIPNPVLPGAKRTQLGDRELTDGEFVTVLLEGVAPIQVLAVPRAAVLSDQQGDYVFVVGPGNKVEQRRVQLGQSTPTTASITSGLKAGEMVVVDGLQRVRPGIVVQPGPATPTTPSGQAAAQPAPAKATSTAKAGK